MKYLLAFTIIMLLLLSACAPGYGYGFSADPADPYVQRAAADGAIQATEAARVQQAAGATLAAAVDAGKTGQEQARLMLPLQASQTAISIANQQAQATATAAVATSTAVAQGATATADAYRETVTVAVLNIQATRAAGEAYWEYQKLGFDMIASRFITVSAVIAFLVILVIVAFEGSAIIFRRWGRLLALHKIRDVILEDTPRGWEILDDSHPVAVSSHRSAVPRAPGEPAGVRPWGNWAFIEQNSRDKATATGLALRLLRDGESVAGSSSNVLPGWRELAHLGWDSPAWQMVKGLLEQARAVRSVEGVGTYVEQPYQCLVELRLALEDRKIRLAPLPHSNGRRKA